MSDETSNGSGQETEPAERCDFCGTPARGDGHAALILTAPTGAGICNGCITQATAMMNEALMRAASTIEDVMRHHREEAAKQEAANEDQ